MQSFQSDPFRASCKAFNLTRSGHHEKLQSDPFRASYKAMHHRRKGSGHFWRRRGPPQKKQQQQETHTHTHTQKQQQQQQHGVETRTIFFFFNQGSSVEPPHPSYRLPDIWEEEKQDLKQTMHQPTRPPMNAKAAIRPPANRTRTDNKGCKDVAHSHSPNRQRSHLTTPPPCCF